MERRRKRMPDIQQLPPGILTGTDQDFGLCFIQAVYEAAKEQCQCASCKFIRELVRRQMPKEG